MSLFSIFKNGDLIGHSKLEYGDPPMGVAFGAFIPAPSFEGIRATAETLDAESRRWQGLTAKTDTGEIIDASAGVAIMEYGAHDNPLAIEVSCLGIAYPQYETLFPHHVKAYDAQFK